MGGEDTAGGEDMAVGVDTEVAGRRTPSNVYSCLATINIARSNWAQTESVRSINV